MSPHYFFVLIRLNEFHPNKGNRGNYELTEIHPHIYQW